MNRRKLITRGVPALATAGLSAFAAQDEPEEDLILQEANILAFEDGYLYEDDDGQAAVPLIELPGSEAIWQAQSEPRLIHVPQLVTPGMRAARVFNLWLPEDDDLSLFETGRDGLLRIRPTPSLALGTKGNTSDGKIKKKYDLQLARFEAFGIIKNDLNPVCVGSGVEGIWLKVDLLGWLLGSLNRWKTYAEGSLGQIKGQPGQFQFHWTKPNICSTGTSNYNAVYNGLLKMLQELVEEIAGAIGKFLDKLLKLSPTIAQFLASTLVKWIGVDSGSGSGTGAAQFNLSASPSSARAARGQSATYTVQVSPQNGFKGTVALTASGSTKSTVSFSPSRLTGGGSARMSVRTSRSSPVGSHQLIIQAVSGSVKKTTPVTLVIT